MKAHHTYHLGTGTLITDATGETMIEQSDYDYVAPDGSAEYYEIRYVFSYSKTWNQTTKLLFGIQL